MNLEGVDPWIGYTSPGKSLRQQNSENLSILLNPDKNVGIGKELVHACVDPEGGGTWGNLIKKF